MGKTIYKDADTGAVLFEDPFCFRRSFAIGQGLIRDRNAFTITNWAEDEGNHIVTIRQDVRGVSFPSAVFPPDDGELRRRVLQLVTGEGGRVGAGRGVRFSEICAFLQIDATDAPRWRRIDRALQWLRKKGSIVTRGQRWYRSGDPRVDALVMPCQPKITDEQFSTLLIQATNQLRKTPQELADHLRIDLPTFKLWSRGKNLPVPGLRRPLLKGLVRLGAHLDL